MIFKTIMARARDKKAGPEAKKDWLGIFLLFQKQILEIKDQPIYQPPPSHPRTHPPTQTTHMFSVKIQTTGFQFMADNCTVDRGDKGHPEYLFIHVGSFGHVHSKVFISIQCL